MPQQRTDEWEIRTPSDLAYHLRQWDSVKRSTVAFDAFTTDLVAGSQRVIDLACGAGSATYYLAAAHPDTTFVGVDLNPALVALANDQARIRSRMNLSFEQGDWFDLEKRDEVDGVVSLQTLSWLPSAKEPLEAIFRMIGPAWIALTSLFYQGEITCWIEVEEHLKRKKCRYNIYSLPEISRQCDAAGYRLSKAVPFAIDIDLPQPVDLNVMQTFTRRLDTGPDTVERLQFSGPLLMNWHMVLIERL